MNHDANNFKPNECRSKFSARGVFLFQDFSFRISVAALPTLLALGMVSTLRMWDNHQITSSFEAQRYCCSLLVYSVWQRRIDSLPWKGTVQELCHLCSCTQLFCFLSVLNLAIPRGLNRGSYRQWIIRFTWGVAPCIWITRLRVCTTLPCFNYCRTTICDRHICSAMFSERPMKDWRGKPCWLHPRESDPEVIQAGGVPVTTSPTLLGAESAEWSEIAVDGARSISSPPRAAACLRNPPLRKAGMRIDDMNE